MNKKFKLFYIIIFFSAFNYSFTIDHCLQQFLVSVQSAEYQHDLSVADCNGSLMPSGDCENEADLTWDNAIENANNVYDDCID